jgi:xanthine dehydrogenase/oxidase
VCGEAVYVDDIKLPADALHAVLVTSSRPHARLLRVDPAAALALPGVEGYYDHSCARPPAAASLGAPLPLPACLPALPD